ncbi:MAG TPA: hypothetical protein VG323_16785 [Thermoanaerobaculia bacterium]|nr:hypothetical protein [Thermoanaerobaculia bacterium]
MRSPRELELEMQLRTIEAEARLLTSRWETIERKNAALTSLYVAVHQLHATLDRAAVVDALREIIVGLIGSETFAVFERDDDTFRAIASCGVDDAEVSLLGRRFASEDDDADVPVAAAIPFVLNGRVIGGIVIVSLLAQKSGFDAVDFELFDLLRTHAAIALYCSGALAAEVAA